MIIADAGLGTINSVVLTVEYLKHQNIKVQGIILNNYTGGIMQEDNIKVIEDLTDIPVIALVKPMIKISILMLNFSKSIFIIKN